MGERIFINRKRVPIPRDHLIMAHLLSGSAGLCLIGAIVGFILAEFWLALGGWLLAIAFKIWFVDRMVWLYDIVSKSSPEYRSWANGQESRDDHELSRPM